jgi:hypothetical protein
MDQRGDLSRQVFTVYYNFIFQGKMGAGSWEELVQVSTVDSRYLEFDGTMEKIRVNRSSTQEELRRYRKCSLFNDERETTRAKF